MKITIPAKLWSQGDSVVVTIPAKWVQWNDIKIGDIILVTLEKKEDNSEKTKEMSSVQEDNLTRHETN